MSQIGAAVFVFDPAAEPIVAGARRRMLLLPAAAGERTVEQLGNALRYAREQAVGRGAVPPPTAERQSSRLASLVACWAVLTAAAAVASHWVGR